MIAGAILAGLRIATIGRVEQARSQALRQPRRVAETLPVIVLLGLASSLQAQELEPPSVAVVAIDETITLDGVLDELAWKRAEAATGFIQREPLPGQPATERSSVRILYSTTTLFVGFIGFDANPKAIIADEMQRDGSSGDDRSRFRGGRLDADDSVSILLDTFHDHRNAFFFETNPNGARSDALITDEGRDRNFEWDGVWEVAARRTPEGWSAEFAIPFSTLRFNQSLSTWGLNVRRKIQHKNEEVYWAPIGLDADLYRISRGGHAEGFVHLQSSLNLRFKPYAIASVTSFADESLDLLDGRADGEGGGNIRWGLTQGLSLDLTFNTDFAQVEVDEQQVNLTRFSLFFPEKREFFLENAGIFEFGPPQTGGGSMRPPLFKLFFSRRIGLEGGDPVPIIAGARLTGKIGHWTLGLLDVQTDDLPKEGGALIPRKNWGALRARRAIGDRSTIGLMMTNREDAGGDYNRTVGFDAQINPSRQLGFNAFYAHSIDPDYDGRGWALGTGFDLNKPLWKVKANFLEVSDEFNPEMGFLLRSGIRRYNGEVGYEPRPETRWLRSIALNGRTEIVTRTNGAVETVDTTFRVSFRFASDDSISLFSGYNFEQLFEPFEISDGIVLPPGEYTDQDIGLYLRSNGSRPLSLQGFMTYGGFFGGYRLMQRLKLRWRPSAHLAMSTSWNYNDVDLDAGSFSTMIVQQRIDVSLTPDLFTNTFIQYNDTADILSINARLNWIYRPGADLFLVYTEEIGASGNALRSANRAFVVKFTYLFIL